MTMNVIYLIELQQENGAGYYRYNIYKTAAAAVFTLTGSDQEPVFLLRKEKFFQLKNGTRAELSRSHSELAKGLLTNNSQWQAYFSGGSLEVIIPIK